MWKSGNYVELNILKRDAEVGYHQGSCDEDIHELLKEPYIARQFARMDKERLVKELKEYGAWDETELASHEDNCARLLWLFCGDIVEGNN